jgi:hypothetical protein
LPFLDMLELQMEQYTLVLDNALRNNHTCYSIISSSIVISQEVQRLLDCTTYIKSGCIRKGEISSINFRMLLFQIQNILICS